MTRAIVCGGRNFVERDLAFQHLDRLHAAQRITLLIEGGATGADRLARSWAKSRCVPIRTYLAQWHNHGNAAGAIRNTTMLQHGKPDLVVAFPGGRGTADMVRQARKAGVPVIEPLMEEM